ncbi:MAG: MmcQ/YjbR family DNA-binding protein [Cruoricaptor ignavus]|nr:MmcQ/YjbR family DNA-binding protein [Cruoricaptor ignavus]
MEIDEIREYCLSKKGATESMPFDDIHLVFKVGGKIFVLIPLDKHPTVFSAKANPEWSEELREEYPQIYGAFHMNKKHWNSVVCEGLKRSLITQIIDHSYDLVYASLTKKIKAEVDANDLI